MLRWWPCLLLLACADGDRSDQVISGGRERDTGFGRLGWPGGDGAPEAEDAGPDGDASALRRRERDDAGAFDAEPGGPDVEGDGSGPGELDMGRAAADGPPEPPSDAERGPAPDAAAPPPDPDAAPPPPDPDAAPPPPPDVGPPGPLATDVEIFVDNFCNMQIRPESLRVPPGRRLQVTYYNRSVDYPVTVWGSYGGGFVDLPPGDVWPDRFEFCGGQRPYEAGADISTACSEFQLVIHCDD